MKISALPLIAPTGIMPSRVPTEVSVCAANHGAEAYVIMQFTTAAGVQFYFFPPEVAQTIAKITADAAQAAGSGLVIAPPGALPKRFGEG